MTTFLALYRGTSIADSEIVAVSAEPDLVADVAARLLNDARGRSPADPILAAQEQGRRRALRLVCKEVEAAERTVPQLEGA